VAAIALACAAALAGYGGELAGHEEARMSASKCSQSRTYTADTARPVANRPECRSSDARAALRVISALSPETTRQTADVVACASLFANSITDHE
jgi:hypothetical protein